MLILPRMDWPLSLLRWLLAVSAAVGFARGNVVVRVWQSQDGLPGNVVRSMVQSTDDGM